jgi:hypothetical protein
MHGGDGLMAMMNGAGGMIIGLAGIGAASGYGSGSGRRPGLKTGSVEGIRDS